MEITDCGAMHCATTISLGGVVETQYIASVRDYYWKRGKRRNALRLYGIIGIRKRRNILRLYKY